MTTSLRLLTSLLLLSAAALCFHHFQPDCLDSFDQEESSPKALDELLPTPWEAHAVYRRVKAKELIIAQLGHGELTLFEAGERFCQLNHEPPDYPDHGMMRFPGSSVQEKACRQVLAWARSHFVKQMSPSELAARLERWEAELSCQLALHWSSPTEAH